MNKQIVLTLTIAVAVIMALTMVSVDCSEAEESDTVVPMAGDDAAGHTGDSSDGTGADAPEEAEYEAQISGQGYETVEAALSAAESGATVTVLKDAEISPTVVSKGITIDLDGFTLTVVNDRTNGYGLKFTTGDSIIADGKIVDARSDGAGGYGFHAIEVVGSGTSLTIENTEVHSYEAKTTANYNYIIWIDEGASFILDSGAKLIENAQSNGKLTYETETFGVVGVAVWGSNDESNPSEVTIRDGTVIDVTAYAVTGNGTSHNTSITIEGGSITSMMSQAIYHPQNGDLYIRGGVITGNTGIEMRAGSLIMTGGKVVATGSPIESEPNYSGSTTSGAGIAIVQHTTTLNTEADIRGGTVEGYVAVYENNTQGGSSEALEKVYVSISGGTFTSTNPSGDGKAVDVADKTGFISGGTFNGGVDESLISPGVDFAVNPDGSIGVGDDIVKDEPSNPSFDDDEDIPPFIPTQPKDSGDDVTIVACAAAAVVAALMAVFLIVSYKKE